MLGSLIFAMACLVIMLWVTSSPAPSQEELEKVSPPGVSEKTQITIDLIASITKDLSDWEFIKNGEILILQHKTHKWQLLSQLNNSFKREYSICLEKNVVEKVNNKLVSAAIHEVFFRHRNYRIEIKELDLIKSLTNANNKLSGRNTLRIIDGCNNSTVDSRSLIV